MVAIQNLKQIYLTEIKLTVNNGQPLCQVFSLHEQTQVSVDHVE